MLISLQNFTIQQGWLQNFWIELVIRGMNNEEKNIFYKYILVLHKNFFH